MTRTRGTKPVTQDAQDAQDTAQDAETFFTSKLPVADAATIRSLDETDSVLVINHTDFPVKVSWANRVFLVRPGVDSGVLIPWMAAKLNFGDATLIDDEERGISDRSMALDRLAFRWGAGMSPMWSDTPRDTFTVERDPVRIVKPYVETRFGDRTLWRHPTVPIVEVRFYSDNGWVRIPTLLDPPVEDFGSDEFSSTNDILIRLRELERQNRQLQEMIEMVKRPSADDITSAFEEASREVRETSDDELDRLLNQ